MLPMSYIRLSVDSDWDGGGVGTLGRIAGELCGAVSLSVPGASICAITCERDSGELTAASRTRDINSRSTLPSGATAVATPVAAPAEPARCALASCTTIREGAVALSGMRGSAMSVFAGVFGGGGVGCVGGGGAIPVRQGFSLMEGFGGTGRARVGGGSEIGTASPLPTTTEHSRCQDLKAHSMNNKHAYP